MGRGRLIGPDGSLLIGQKRRVWMPRDLGLVLAESWCTQGVTLGTAPRAQGTAPPVLTYGGTLTGGVFPYVQIDSVAAGSALGQATYKVSYDDGATFPHTGITTAAGPVALPGIGAAITASFAAGPYNTNNIYQPLAAQVNDINGLGNHASMATVSARPFIRAAAFNGKPCLDFGTATTIALTIPNITLGPFTLFALVQGNATSEYLAVHVTDASTNGNYVYGQLANASSIARSSVVSQKQVSATWLSDGTRRSVAVTFGGTHASHKIYRNAVADTLSNGPATGDPGTGTVTGTFNLGRSQANANGFKGLIAGWVLMGRETSALDITRLHRYGTVTKGFAL